MELEYLRNTDTAVDKIINDNRYALKTFNVYNVLPHLVGKGLRWFNGKDIRYDDELHVNYDNGLYVVIDNRRTVHLFNSVDPDVIRGIIIEDVLTINDKVYTDEDKAIECIRNFFHPFPSVGDTIFWVSAGGIVKKDTFRDNVFCKRIKELGNYYKTKEEAKIIADKVKEIFKK